MRPLEKPKRHEIDEQPVGQDQPDETRQYVSRAQGGEGSGKSMHERQTYKEAGSQQVSPISQQQTGFFIKIRGVLHPVADQFVGGKSEAEAEEGQKVKRDRPRLLDAAEKHHHEVIGQRDRPKDRKTQKLECDDGPEAKFHH
ncbi:hypothetical protein J5J09_15155 [Ciceribacter sp. L1K22]|nr:hypothetical protein [Ciceribacter sp. L1K22]